jgi:EEF1A lysine methyltransferase 2
MKSGSEHWNNIFSKTEDKKLGWYEKDTAQTFRLLNRIPNLERASVFLSGIGKSTLVEEIYPQVKSLILNDISDEALSRLKEELKVGPEKTQWLCQDISQPFMKPITEVDIWIDRAVLHFLISEHDVEGYFRNLKSALKVGGYALFAEFSLTGSPKCAGLPVHRYSVEELSTSLGSSFKVVSHFNYTYVNPFGDEKPYVYALFKREK